MGESIKGRRWGGVGGTERAVVGVKQRDKVHLVCLGGKGGGVGCKIGGKEGSPCLGMKKGVIWASAPC